MKEGWDLKTKEKVSDYLKEFGRSSFELSGYRTSKRQWESINKFSKLINKCPNSK